MKRFDGMRTFGNKERRRSLQSGLKSSVSSHSRSIKLSRNKSAGSNGENKKGDVYRRFRDNLTIVQYSTVQSNMNSQKKPGKRE